MEFHYVDLRTFCYATESMDRVESAMRFFLPEEAEIEVEESEGHHGDDIRVLSTRQDNADDVRYVFDRVLEAGVDEVRDEIQERLDEDCKFHLRLDKQAAFDGEARFGRGVQVSAKVEAYPAKRENALEAVERSLFDG